MILFLLCICICSLNFWVMKHATIILHTLSNGVLVLAAHADGQLASTEGLFTSLNTNLKL